MNNYPWRIQIVYALLLSLIILWIFLPITIGLKLLGSTLAVVIAGTLFYRLLRYRRLLNAATKNIAFLAQKLDLLPARQRYRLPLFLVTGNSAKAFFPSDLTLAEQNIVVSSEAVWIYVEEYSELPIVFDSLVARWPDMLGRIGLLLAVAPEEESKAGLFTAKLQAFRQSWVDTCKMAKYRLPVYVSAHISLNSLHYHDNATLPVYWYQIIAQKLYLLDEYLSPLDNWVHDKTINSLERQQRLSVRVMLNEYQAWIKTNILDVLSDPKQPLTKCIPVGTVIYPLNSQQVNDNLIERMFASVTTLSLPHSKTSEKQIIAPPDRLIKFMPIAYPNSPIRKTVCNMIVITALFLMAALGASYWNNIKLAQQVHSDIHTYDLIAMDSYSEKREALALLKADRRLLNDYFKQGEPIKLGLGLYHGQRLLEPLSQAISRYVPEPPPPPAPPPPPPPPAPDPTPPIFSFDALSLFESGKMQLKPEATKTLIDALMAIKLYMQQNSSKGWLVLVSGHTDTTGDSNKNQQLSLDRAAAVRNWMIQASNIPENCFAVQGYGANKPLVSNDTPQGRAQNRRVEISLVPQISTCKLIDEN
ncbi:OmpA family protein [Orbus sturtevantii]|uniref:OmpA family protein n=1 Tax=Orbus sturtevantii TaxID=3074109 RepID=UPI00370D5116